MRQRIHSNKSQNRIKAFALVEVLIALIFVASTMILALQTLSKSLKVVKDNEKRDKATSILLKSVEYGNSYNQFEFPVNHDYTGSGKCFRLAGGDSYTLALDLVEDNCDPVNDEIDECDNRYMVREEGMEICNQIIITDRSLLQPGIAMEDKWRVTSIVLYQIDERLVKERFDTYVSKSLTVNN